MMKKEQVIGSLREQENLLAELIRQFESKNNLDHSDCGQYDKITKEVENNLRRMQKLAAEDFLKFNR
jgi:vacuolar-type H+-ATPase subunit H